MNRVDSTTLRLERLVEKNESSGVLKLPSEVELSAQLGVSRSTLRDALSRLESSGRIERKRGRGTVILTRPPDSIRYPVNLVNSFSGFLEASGVAYDLREFAVTRAKADKEAQAALELGEDDEVFEVSRVYALGAQPAAYLCHVLAPTILNRPLAVDRIRADIVPFLEEVHGLTVTVTSAITAEGATPALAAKLNTDPGGPVLVMYTRIRESGGSTIALGALAFNPAVVALGVEAIQHLTARAEDGLPVGWLRERTDGKQ